MAKCLRERPWLDPFGLGLIAFVSAALVGLLTGISVPMIHDEFAYILMGKTFALGRLTNPTPPFWEHLEAFHILMTPSYMGKYPPAQGLFIALGVLMGHPILGIWLSSGLMVWAVTWMLQPWMGRRWALAGGIVVLLNLGIGSGWAQGYWGGAVAASGGAIVFGSIWRGWHSPRWRHGLMFGLGLLILANSRPYEGLLVSLPPLGAAVVLFFSSRFNWSRKAPMFVGLILVLGSGFLAMGVYNQAVTGSPLVMPYQEYQKQYATAPNSLLSSPQDPPPVYRHEDFREFWIEWDLGRHDSMTTLVGFFRTRFLKALFQVVLLGPAVLGLLFIRPSLKDPWTRLSLLGAGLAWFGCILTKGAYPHYLAPAVGPLVLLALMGWREASQIDNPEFNGKRVLKVAAVVSIIVAGGYIRFSALAPPAPPQVRRAEISACLDGFSFPSLVLVEYPGFLDHTGDWIRNEPDPFRSKVVWARSMGPVLDSAIVQGNLDRAVWKVPSDGLPANQDPRTIEFISPPADLPIDPNQPIPFCK